VPAKCISKFGSWQLWTCLVFLDYSLGFSLFLNKQLLDLCWGTDCPGLLTQVSLCR